MTVTYDAKRDRYYIILGEIEYSIHPGAMRELYGEMQDAINLRKSIVDVKK